jgi:hypothetical protein
MLGSRPVTSGHRHWLRSPWLAQNYFGHLSDGSAGLPNGGNRNVSEQYGGPRNRHAVHESRRGLC